MVAGVTEARVPRWSLNFILGSVGSPREVPEAWACRVCIQSSSLLLGIWRIINTPEFPYALAVSINRFHLSG